MPGLSREKEKIFMKNLKAKLQKRGGFTLIEMLIVVAIIAILIAISIPLVGSALERARVATDAANERAAKAEMIIVYLNAQTGTTPGAGDVTYTRDTIYVYDAATGKLKTDATGVNAYGQCTNPDHKGKILSVTYDEAKAEVYMSWNDGKATTLTASTGLCSTDLMKTTAG